MWLDKNPGGEVAIEVGEAQDQGAMTAKSRTFHLIEQKN